jgi:hypothetical protein
MADEWNVTRGGVGKRGERRKELDWSELRDRLQKWLMELDLEMFEVDALML